MAFCENCGTPYEGSPAFCESCGSPLPRRQESAPASDEQGNWQAQPSQTYSAPSPGPSPQTYYDPNQPQGQYQAGYQAQAFRQAVEPYAAGGLIAWSIVTLLLCTIPGVVALVNAVGINKASSYEEQQKKISRTKTWCIIGTVLGVLALIGSAIANQD